MSEKKVTYLEAISQAIREEMLRDEAVFILGEDVGTYGGAFKVSAGLLEEFGPERVIDTPMAEAAIIGSAIGAALMGMRPIAEMQFIDFITCGFDQIINMARAPTILSTTYRTRCRTATQPCAHKCPPKTTGCR
jgi:pyruvate/2-oxoglutarate/acetoin dehydrogenase E1 component